MRILLIGADGQVGAEVRKLDPSWAEIISVGKKDIDLRNEESIRCCVRDLVPNAIVNATSFPTVEAAEQDWEECFAINATLPGILAVLSDRIDALLVQYSTNYVFDGKKKTPYVEEDATSPLNVYGASRIAAERFILSSRARALILRTSWVYSVHGDNFLPLILRRAQEQRYLDVVDDQIGSPTSAKSIAKATEHLIYRYANGAKSEFPTGIFHLAAQGTTSWCGFASAILKSVYPKGGAPALRPISSGDYPTPVRRPENSILSSEKLRRVFGLSLDSWQQQLPEVLAELPANLIPERTANSQKRVAAPDPVPSRGRQDR